MGIAGSSRVGRNCFLGGQVGIADHVTIGDNCKIGSQSGINGVVPDGEVRLGSPAMPGIQHHRSMAALKDLPSFMREMRAVAREVKELKGEYPIWSRIATA